MIVDALMEANPVFKFHEKIYDPVAYMKFTDNILPLIETSRNPALAKS